MVAELGCGFESCFWNNSYYSIIGNTSAQYQRMKYKAACRRNRQRWSVHKLLPVKMAVGSIVAERDDNYIAVVHVTAVRCVNIHS